MLDVPRHVGLRAAAVLGLALAGGAPSWPAAAVSVDEAAEAQRGEELDEGEEDDEEDEEDLRQRLTEREDQRRPAAPWSALVAGRPLTVSGEYELELAWVRRFHLEDVDEDERDPPDRLILEHGLEVEGFYSFGEPLSLFVQLRVAMEDDLVHGRFDEVSASYVERGEMWLHSEDVLGTGVDFEVGRLAFEDERRWWWDGELDGVRLAYETERVDVALALARELAPERGDRDGIDPEHEDVLRVLGEASWDWLPNQTLELFLLHQDDRSGGERPGALVHEEDEDESDARLTWLGARLMGVYPLRTRGLLGYWADVAWVGGEEEVLELEAVSRRRSVVEGASRRDVSGWAIDAGAAWILALPYEPRLFAGYAFGSGDSSRDAGRRDHAFRQSGLQANEAGFGGVERFPHYGVLLDPELSNLEVWTVGVGATVLRSSSVDLVYHHYRLARPSASLPDARFEAELTGRDRDVGHAVDLVLALEEWERVEFELIGSLFRAGRAFGARRGAWSAGGFFAVRVAF